MTTEKKYFVKEKSPDLIGPAFDDDEECLLQEKEDEMINRTYYQLLLCIVVTSLSISLAIAGVVYLVTNPENIPKPITDAADTDDLYLDDGLKDYIRAETISMALDEAYNMHPSFNDKVDFVAGTDTVISCYYNAPTKPMSQTPLLPQDIDPHICTHVILGFAYVTGKAIDLDDSQTAALSVLTNNLRRRNPKLKIMVSVGGSRNDRGFPDMVVNHASRKIFIKSIKEVLHTYTLDGIDLDWEFPALHDDVVGFKSRERQHFSQLVREIRAEFIREKRNYILTVATAAPMTIVDFAYDVDQLNLYVDFVNLMTYDYHAFTKYTPFTGLNSPLYSKPSDLFYMATLNINYTVHMYIAKGLDRNKIVVGIPTYGHIFGLVNPNNPEIGSPACKTHPDTYGFIDYYGVCQFITKDGHNATVKYASAEKVPYCYKDDVWISYDNPQSVQEKAKYIKEMGLRGAMIYSLNADDYRGCCDAKPNKAGLMMPGRKFPLLKAVNKVLVPA